MSEYMLMKDEKCCADCKHCVRRYNGEVTNYYCGLTSRRDRVSGEFAYNSCNATADTEKCKFEKSYGKLIEGVITCIITILIGIAFWRNICC